MPTREHLSDQPSGGGPVDHGLPELAPDVVEQEQGDQLDNPVPTRGYHMMPVVGLGGSAGGLAALQAFFAAMPVDGGMAFVVIMHLSPEHDSILAELLQRTTAMPVLQVQGRVKVEADHVYVIPPAKHLSMDDEHLILSEPARRSGKHVAVDLFFRTLADTHGPRAAAVVLSGADGDGAIGIKRIKERGGLAVVQEPNEAEHDSMPRAAIATGLVDWVLPVMEMPAKLRDYWRAGERLRLPDEHESRPARDQAPAAESNADAKPEDEQALRDTLVLLKARTGHDFSCYKRATVLRRVGRRLQVNGIEDMPGYLAFLRAHTNEAEALLDDLLISVTNFFRDREAFTAIEARVPALFRGKGPGDTVRVWVAACATGEEAYSMAMLLCEHAATLDRPPKLQVFATDLHERAIHAAREGAYPETIAADVSEERLRRFFAREHGGYRVKREVREIVLFALHDLLKDSPFSKLDLVSCRNLLIYLNRDAQTRALEIFHFALCEEGTLFLGTSESVDDGSPLFAAADKKRRIYARRAGTRAALPLLPGPSTLTRALRARSSERGPVVEPLAPAAAADPAAAPPPASETSPVGDAPVPLDRLHFELIEHLAPPSVIVNREHEVLHVSEHASRFLQVSSGELTKDLLHLVHPMLRLELRAMLYRAAQATEPVETRGVPIEREGVRTEINLRVGRLRSSTSGHLVVIFQEQAAAEESLPRPAEGVPESVLRHLEQEVEQLKAQLRDTVEQAEASDEEQKASNEELQAINEELRAATEELETGREELQSTNEELSTVNQELKSKVDELGRSNSDLANLMASTQIATLFLDRKLCIQRYTPPAVALFSLIPTDVGRPISDLTSRLNYPDLAANAERVLDQLSVVELEVAHQDGRYFLARMLPYRTTSDYIGGVVLTCVDISERKRAEAALTESLRQIEEQTRIFDTTLSAIADFAYIFDRSGRFLYANRALADLLGLKPEALVGKSFHDLPYPPELAAKLQRQIQQVFETGEALTDEAPFTNPAGQSGIYEYILRPVRSADGASVEFVAGSTRDITARKRAETAQMNFRQIFESAPGNYVVLEPDTFRVAAVSDAYLQTTGTKRDAFVNKTIFEVFPDPPDVRIEVSRLMRTSFERVKATRCADAMAAICYPLPTPEGGTEERWWSPLNSPIFGEGGELAYVIHRVEDVTPFVLRNRAEGREEQAFAELEDRAKHFEADIVLRGQDLQRANARLRDSERSLQMAMEAGRLFSWELDPRTMRVAFSSNMEDIVGFALGADADQNMGMIHPADLAANQAAIDRALETSGDYSAEFRLVNSANGTVQWFHAQGAVTCNTADGSPRLVGVTENITARKRAELNTAFLAEISVDLARFWTADEIMQVVGAKIGAHLGLSSCTFMDIDEAADQATAAYDWHRADAKSLLGTYRIQEFVTGDFQRACRAGEAFVVRDTVADPRTDAVNYAAIGVRAFVSVPILREGAWRFLLVMFDAVVHDWREDEIELMREVTARIWTRLERARNEEALRESEARLRAVFDSSREFALITMDVEGRITAWNPGAELIFDCPAAEMLGRDAHALYSPDDNAADVLKKEMSEAGRTGRAGNDRWMQGCKGRRFWASGSVMPLRVEGQPPHGFLKILRDMTGVHQSELARREAEDRFALVVQSIRDYAIYMLDASGHVTTWNEGAERIKGYTPAEAIGQPFSFCFTPEALAAGKPAQELEIAAKEGRFQEENWRMRKDGTRYWGDELIVALRAEDGELIAFAKFCRDLTNRKRYEDERTRLLAAERAARAEAESASKAKDHFLAVLSHELRTPLTPVLMAVHLMGRNRNLSASARDALEMIERNVQIEAHLIDDLLDLTKITRGKLEIVRQPMDLHQAVQHAVEITAADVQGKSQQVTVALDAAEHNLQGDTTRLQQVFWNLLKNASKFTPDGGSIRITSRNEPGRVVVEISDTGIGFEAEAATRIFDAFTQANDEVMQKFGGLGLGLAISKATVDAHGGSLRARSEGRGQGAIFTVELPLSVENGEKL